MSSAEPRGEIGDGGLGSEALVDQFVLVLGLGVEGLGQSGLGGVNLLIDELAAAPVFPRPVRDGLSPGEHLDSQIPPFSG